MSMNTKVNMNTSINTTESLMTLQNISLYFPDHDRPILVDITTTIYKGQCVMVLGGNGSGKSTLIKLINRTYSTKNGDVRINEKKLSEWDAEEFAQSVVTLEQDPRSSLFYDLTVLENCILWETRFGENKLRFRQHRDRQFYQGYLTQFHPNLPSRLNSEVRLLSGGEKQALLLGLCVYKPPALLLLDEHTSALDPNQAELIMEHTVQAIKKAGITTLMTTHNLDHALKFGDRLLGIKEGKIVFDVDNEAKRKLTKPDLLKFCY